MGKPWSAIAWRLKQLDRQEHERKLDLLMSKRLRDHQALNARTLSETEQLLLAGVARLLESNRRGGGA